MGKAFVCVWMLYPCTCGFITEFCLPILGIGCLKKKVNQVNTLGQDRVTPGKDKSDSLTGSLNIEAVISKPAL